MFVDLGTPIAYAPRTFRSPRQVRDFIAGHAGAPGATSTSQFARALHAVPYEGIACSQATIVSGAYPARRPLGFVTRGRPRGELKRLPALGRDTTRRRKRVIATRYVVPS